MPNESGGDSDTEAGVRRSARYRLEVTNELLDASVAHFGRHGFELSKVAEIARQCGVTTGSIYSRWTNKRMLFAGAVDHVTGELSASALQQAKDSNAGAQGALHALVESWLTPELDHVRDLVLEAYVIARRDPEIEEYALQSLNHEIDSLVAFIEEGKQSGTVDRRLSTEAMAQCCQALLVGVHLVSAAFAGKRPAPSGEEWSELIVRFMTSVAPPDSDG